MAMGDREQRARVRGPVLAHYRFEQACDSVGRCDREYDEAERERPPPERCENETDDEPDEPVRPDLRKPHKDVVERMPPVVDHPTLYVAIPASQALSVSTGAISFVRSIICRRPKA